MNSSNLLHYSSSCEHLDLLVVDLAIHIITLLPVEPVGSHFLLVLTSGLLRPIAGYRVSSFPLRTDVALKLLFDLSSDLLKLINWHFKEPSIVLSTVHLLDKSTIAITFHCGSDLIEFVS